MGSTDETVTSWIRHRAHPRHPRWLATGGRCLTALLAVTLVAGCEATPTERASPTIGTGPSGSTSSAGPGPPRPQVASPMPSAPTTTPTPPTAAEPSRLAEYGDRGSNEIALTFTVGYRLDPAVEILELLTERGVAATIFMSGIVFDKEETRATAERVLQIIADRPDLFQLGQHGYGATELAGLSRSAVIAEVRGAERTLAGYGAPYLRPYFSPPGGAWSPELLDTLGSLGYSRTVLWDVDPLDWKPPVDGGPSAAEVAARVLDHIQGGSIVLLHLGGFNTLPALPDIIGGLAARGYRPVTVAELLAGD